MGLDDVERGGARRGGPVELVARAHDEGRRDAADAGGVEYPGLNNNGDRSRGSSGRACISWRYRGMQGSRMVFWHRLRPEGVGGASSAAAGNTRDASARCAGSASSSARATANGSTTSLWFARATPHQAAHAAVEVARPLVVVLEACPLSSTASAAFVT